MMNMESYEMQGFDNPAYVPDSPAKKPTRNGAQHEIINNQNGSAAGGGGIHPADIHFDTKAAGSDGTLNISATDDGASIKPSIRRQVRHFHGKLRRQVIYSVLRNFLCYMFTFCLFVVLINAEEFSDWDTLTEVVLLMLMCFGLAGIPAQGLHIYRELRDTRQTLIPQMLARWKYKDDFVSMCQAWQMAAPYISVEITLNSGTVATNDPEHWTRTTRRTEKKLSYRIWTDQSENIHSIPWTETGANWILLTKDYRTVNRETQKAIEEDVAAFSMDSLYDNYKRYMHRDYLLDVAEGQTFPDVQPFVVFQKPRSKFYEFRTYKIMLCLCLDSVYNLIFHAATRHTGEYCIVKYIER